jgi:hypothetical protein
MERQHLDAELARRAHGFGNRVRDVVQFQVEKNVGAGCGHSLDDGWTS